jgi:hypothetical protein
MPRFGVGALKRLLMSLVNGGIGALEPVGVGELRPTPGFVFEALELLLKSLIVVWSTTRQGYP